jgi:inhibitor of cysteine peptidase
MEVRLDGSESVSKMELGLGDHLFVNLAGNPTTGYQWQVVSCKPEVLDWTEGPTYLASDPGLVGSGGTFRFGFKPVKKGRATIKLVYRRPWEEGIAPAKTVVLKVRVE